ncbi:hypothetical protein [Methanosarcina acetivorans]|uniref:hypothetical protein n=1 Tax=Methanosarcina acetivorans TaxID=2214 RepID=UPI0024798338|nr:hypothetical protein [Methanosarcina acetivorans]
MGCMDIKPYSCPNSINVDNNGIVTIGIGTNEHTYDEDDVEGYPVDYVFGSVILLLETSDGSVVEGPITVSPKRYEYVADGLVLNSCPSGDSFTGAGYLLKIRTKDLLPLFGNHVDEEGLYLRIEAGDLLENPPSYLFNTRDSVRLISNNKK